MTEALPRLTTGVRERGSPRPWPIWAPELGRAQPAPIHPASADLLFDPGGREGSTA